MEMTRLEGDTYRTGPRKVSFLAGIFPALIFYSDLLSLVVRGSRKAKRGSYDTSDWSNSSFEAFQALERVGVQLEITGMNNFKSLDGPCVFIGNHMSTLETFVLPTIIATFKEATFVVKESLVDYPVFKHIMRSRRPITVGRSNPRDDLKAVFENGTEKLRAGSSIIIFRKQPVRRSLTPSSSIPSGSSLRSGRTCRWCPLRSKPTPGATAGISRISAGSIPRRECTLLSENLCGSRTAGPRNTARSLNLSGKN